ncbi:MAG: 6-chlorohydroxyquinol-1,2-dioxygenase [Streptosporangiales bacterium]|nr:6-chlorohydroxyquinol-1,2-dioxygenase [Streptosporangiales bacterium]
MGNQQVKTTTPEEITEAAVGSFDSCPDERTREILQKLVRHLHAFAVDARLTEEEWMAGIQFLTRTGQACTDTRQEFILLSDTLGLSMAVDAINHGKGADATESTVLGPFYVPDSPWRANGDAINIEADGEPVIVQGRVTNTADHPIAGAVVDVWQNSTNELYAVQDPSQPPDNLRGRFRAGDDGRFWFRTIRPVDYPIPHDGPVGEMLASVGRHPWRPAHIHLIVSAPGYEPVTTHIFDADSRYLDSDAVFGVKSSLIREFQRHDPATEPAPPGVDRPWYTVDCSLALEPAG